MVRVQRSLLLALLATVPLSAASACGSKQGGTFTTSTGTATGGTGGVTTSSSHTGMAGGISFNEGGPGGPYADFPSAPVVDPSAPANAADLFGGADAGQPDAGSSGGPCIFEPEPDTLFPNNWLRPRFNWSATGGQNLFEIRLHTSAEINDLIVYTATAPWQMPKDMWAALAQDAQDVPITVTIRGAVLSNGALQGPPVVGSVQTMTIAPAPAAGTIVYWTTSGNSSLKAFAVGDETVVPALVPGQVQMKTNGGADVTCVGCHTSTPDGNYASFTAQGPWSNALGSVQMGSVGAAPPFLGAGAAQVFQTLAPLGIHSYSKAHYATGDHIMVTPIGDSPSNYLGWIDLEATSSASGTAYGPIARTGDTKDVGAPTWSHDGNTIVYVSNTCELTGRLDACPADLYSVPYNNRAGGAATPVAGASDPNINEYYPTFSSDDAYLAFNEIPNGQKMYDAPAAEVFVIPSHGGTATRLAANDPAACLGKTSPGQTNSWPKWSPQVTIAANGKTYYWLIFSSLRDPNAMGNHQLYATGVVVNGTTVETHGAIYIWNQPEAESNHTPAWDFFNVPTPPPG